MKILSVPQETLAQKAEKAQAQLPYFHQEVYNLDPLTNHCFFHLPHCHSLVLVRRPGSLENPWYDGIGQDLYLHLSKDLDLYQETQSLMSDQSQILEFVLETGTKCLWVIKTANRSLS